MQRPKRITLLAVLAAIQASGWIGIGLEMMTARGENLPAYGGGYQGMGGAALFYLPLAAWLVVSVRPGWRLVLVGILSFAILPMMLAFAFDGLPRWAVTIASLTFNGSMISAVAVILVGALGLIVNPASGRQQASDGTAPGGSWMSAHLIAARSIGRFVLALPALAASALLLSVFALDLRMAGGLAVIIGLVVVALGVLGLVVAYGFWALKPWAWPLGIALQVATIGLAIARYINVSKDLSNPIILASIAAITLYILYQPRAKAAFGHT